ncbi:GntR family transcriptional regulator [Carbonactinospora thermoautotrophica]|uniref:GntR family transcriptional regulator n=1 Tax=Carbonactinospora thermoautotrophica TaxID=1469144 RepID=UPI00226F860D|nr:GntR family transcriptional regulator [Carbonactinospora thermoautotrophica]
MARGHIETLPSGSYRAIAYLGVDPLTRKQRSLKGKATKDYAKASRDLADFLDQAEQEQEADTKATVAFLLDRYLDVADIGPTTRPGYEGYVRRTLKPHLGDIQIRKVRAVTLEQFYARLRVCSQLRDGRLAGKTVTEVRRFCSREREVKVYTHRTPPADRRAAQILAAELIPPTSPVGLLQGPALYRQIAANLRAAIEAGKLAPGDLLPTVVELGEWYGVSRSTAQRAMKLLADDRLIVLRRGARLVVATR